MEFGFEKFGLILIGSLKNNIVISFLVARYSIILMTIIIHILHIFMSFHVLQYTRSYDLFKIW